MELRNIHGIECPIITKFLPPNTKWVVIWDGFIICFTKRPQYNKEERGWDGKGYIQGRIDYYNEYLSKQAGKEDTQDALEDEEKYIWRVG